MIAHLGLHVAVVERVLQTLVISQAWSTILDNQADGILDELVEDVIGLT